MAQLFRAARINVGSGQTRQYGPVVVPDSGYTYLRVTMDLSDEDMLDPEILVELTLDQSADGVTYIPSGGAVTVGNPSRALTGVQPRLRVPMPPAGSLVRATLRAGSTPVLVGVIVEGF